MCIVVVYVDHIILKGPNLPLIHSLKQHLHQVFTIKDLGSFLEFFSLVLKSLNYLLGLFVVKENSQRKC